MIYAHNDLLLVVVEKSSDNFEIKSHTNRFGRHKFVLDNLKNRYGLPHNNYSIIGKLKDITEEQAKGLVEPCNSSNCINYRFYSECAIKGIHSIYRLRLLIASLSIPLTETQTILILKEQ